MILNNLTEAKEFLPSVNLTVGNERLLDFFRRAQDWLVSRIIGTGIETALEETYVAESDPLADLRRLCRRVIAEKALLDAIPEMDMQLTEAGFAVQDNDNFSPASAQRVDRLLAKMPKRIASDADALVSYMISAYPNWRSSEQFKRLTESFMPTIADYSSVPGARAYNSYDEFYSDLPVLNRSMKEVAAYYVSSAEIDRLLELYRDNDLLEIHRRAIEELKVAAVASANGSIRCARNAAARARDVMLESPGDFPCFRGSSAFSSMNVNLDGGKIVNFT